MRKRIISLFLSCVLFMLSVPSVAFAADDSTSSCYIATTECPAAYTEYATENISKFILSIGENIC